MKELRAYSCPSCGGPVPHAPGSESIRCQYCGSVLNLHRSLCPDCGVISPEDQRFCGQCGTALVRTCPACNLENWAGNEHCTRCGRALDLVEMMTFSQVRDTRTRLELQQLQALAIKQREAGSAEARMARFHELERLRREAVARGNALRRRRERRMVAIALIVAAFLVFLVIVTTLQGSGLGV